MTELKHGDFYIPKRLIDAEFATYKAGSIGQRAALKACMEYTENGLENIKSGKGIFLHGPVGTGKTHLAIATLKALVGKYPEEFEAGREYSGSRPNIRAQFISVVDLLNVIKDSFSGIDVKRKKADEMLFAAKYYELIVMDDIGAEKPTEWVEEQLFAIVDQRYRAEKATVFTTNCSIADIEGQLGARITSRIIDMTNGVNVDGPDYRKRKLA